MRFECVVFMQARQDRPATLVQKGLAVCLGPLVQLALRDLVGPMEDLPALLDLWVQEESQDQQEHLAREVRWGHWGLQVHKVQTVSQAHQDLLDLLDHKVPMARMVLMVLLGQRVTVSSLSTRTQRP